MKVKKINMIMILFSLIGGGTGALIGELALNKLMYKLPDALLIGLYFGIVALFIAIACYIAEFIVPVLNGYNWKLSYSGISLKFLPLTSFILIFVVSTILQFIYGLNFLSSPKINDVVMLIDVSGSMKSNDPQNDRFTAVEDLINSMDKSKRVSVITFNDKSSVVIPMSFVNEQLKESLKSNLNDYKDPDGSTDIKTALQTSIQEIKDSEENDRNAMVILLTDGLDSNNLNSNMDEAVTPYIDARIPVYTIGLMSSDFNLLQDISSKTNGAFYNINSVSKLKDIYTTIYHTSNQRLLIDRRSGVLQYSSIYTILRITFITIISIAIGLGMGIMFDNKNIVKSFTIGGVLSGIIAGIIFEFGFRRNLWTPFTIRLVAVFIIAFLYSLIPTSIVIGLNNEAGYEAGMHTYNDSTEEKNNRNIFH